MQKSNNGNQMRTAIQLLIPTKGDSVNGVRKKIFEDSDIIMCNFKSYGGTEEINNGILSVIDTAQITCWFNPKITSGCRIKKLSDKAIYEILGTPENFEEANMQMTFKVRRIKGGA